MKNLTSRLKGEIAHLKVKIRSAEKKFIISEPAIDARYDFIIDTGRELLRTQVKYSDCIDDSKSLKIKLKTKSGKKYRPYKTKDCDLILIYIPEKECIVSLTPEIFNNKTMITINLKRKKSELFWRKFIW
ncbi:MAG: group I intron-associated PD-(D/E)XK endonuclease [Nanoarchaeota archaeon]